ncbi:hypothetical protein [Treponema porcinum]|uniref:Glycogen recognition site of AMP-activated protein kinase n=2 Tax=Treponema porcinum TaxID=261392 RepID=A0A1T4NB91_TREPO|nr:hypothetical protein [Treponema porcinum]SJZ76532.1 Glycogen recognition site of AMP-activated protein kinase [Treponema porcinum]
MKKLFAFISLFLLLSIGSAFADVTVKKLADGNVEVTFFYGNPRATEVLLAGDFNNWQNGAEAMTKTDKGFTITKTFKATDELRYKFISDGNWTTDLKAPDFVDDGFGGKNSHVVIADMLGGDDDAAASKAKINFVSWSMFGIQANYLTQGAYDKTEKGLDLDSVTIGAKSYNKFVGNFLPNCPVYIEVALAETDLEDYSGEKKIKYLYQKNGFDDESLEFSEGLKQFVSGMFANPVAYLARANNNGKDVASEGPGSNPFLGHLKFGFNTPYINFLTGFNYAKPDVRQAITWTTVCSSWDAGYQHVGGFNQFSLGSKAVAALEEATGLTFDIGFAPNKTGDRKGTKYGYWGWFDVKKDDLVIDFQTNGMYNGDYLFYEPVEHDFIIGAKDKIGGLSFAVQALLATHQKSTAEIVAFNAADNPEKTDPNILDYFGYSTDVWYRSGDFDGIQNMAANVQVGYKADLFNVNLEYRFRGMQASMLYLRENHDDGTFDLSNTLGLLNSQRIAFNGSVNPLEALKIDLGVTAEMALSELKAGDEEYDVYNGQVQSWWTARRFDEEDTPLFNRTGGAEFTFKPAVAYTLEDYGITIGAYGDMNYQAYQWSDGIDEDEANKYGASDSPFRFKKAGVSFAMTPDSDIVKGVNVYYGLDMSNKTRYFNTLIGQVMFPGDVTANLAFGLKTENTLSDGDVYKFNSDENNPFAFAVGVSKRFKAMKKPTLYAQFVYNMDPFKHFGDGQDALNLDRCNVNGSHEKEGVGKIDAVDWYDGRAAMRVGIRWDI